MQHVHICYARCACNKKDVHVIYNERCACNVLCKMYMKYVMQGAQVMLCKMYI